MYVALVYLNSYTMKDFNLTFMGVASLNNDWFNSNKLNNRNHEIFFSHCYLFHGN